MSETTIFFIGVFSGIIAGAGLTYWLAHDYLNKMIETRSTAALNAVYKERDALHEKLSGDLAALQAKIDAAKQKLQDKIDGK